MDCTGEIIDRWTEGDSLWMKVAITGQGVAQYIVPKGFICIDGTSLTICDVFYGTIRYIYANKHTIITTKRYM